MSQWTELERRFYEDACRKGSKVLGEIYEMFCGRVMHPPVDGKYCSNMDVHIYGLYQSWTGPAKAKVPVIQGPAGRDGRDGYGVPGPQGPMGPQGPPGPPGEVRFVMAPSHPFRRLDPARKFYFEPGYLSISASVAALVGGPTTKINNTVRGGEGGDACVGPIDIENNNALTAVQTTATGVVVNDGPGSATGAVTAGGEGQTESGSK